MAATKMVSKWEVPEHPDIEWALRTGYPGWMQEKGRNGEEEWAVGFCGFVRTDAKRRNGTARAINVELRSDCHWQSTCFDSLRSATRPYEKTGNVS